MLIIKLDKKQLNNSIIGKESGEGHNQTERCKNCFFTTQIEACFGKS